MTDAFAEYAEAERLAVENIGKDKAERLGLYWWDSAGLDYSASNKNDLIRFHDQMQDGRFTVNISLMGELSNKELWMLETAGRIVFEFGKTIGKPTAARDAVTRAMYQWKIVASHFDLRNSILEIGPGSGYLGLMAMLAGHDYKAIERASGFYHYQRELWNFAARHIIKGKATHIPWWRLADEQAFEPVGVATINHAICEIHPDGLHTMFSFLRRSTFTVVIEDVGLQKTPKQTALDTIKSAGWHISSFPNDVHICRREPRRDIETIFNEIEGAQ
ncbi:MAG: hypothetical protein EBR82_66225 [Caulobacteraceae bacterium]|nr:hypothetical protein [Caulobacteraceae bacterium]